MISILTLYIDRPEPTDRQFEAAVQHPGSIVIDNTGTMKQKAVESTSTGAPNRTIWYPTGAHISSFSRVVLQFDDAQAASL